MTTTHVIQKKQKQLACMQSLVDVLRLEHKLITHTQERIPGRIATLRIDYAMTRGIATKKCLQS